MNLNVKHRLLMRLMTGIVFSAACALYGDNILLIGDSISLDYQNRAQIYAGSRHNIVHTMTNALFSTYCRMHVGDWLSKSSQVWDVVHFNVGLHDICRDPDNSAPPRVSAAAYQQNLLDIVEIIREDSPCAVIVFALTTPILPQETRLPEDVAIYNSAATNILADQNVYINDLYSQMLPNQDEYHVADGTHFTPEGNQFNAENVVDFIDSIPRPPPCLWIDGRQVKYVARSNGVYNVYFSTNPVGGHWRLIETNSLGRGEVRSFQMDAGGDSSGWYWLGAAAED